MKQIRFLVMALCLVSAGHGSEWFVAPGNTAGGTGTRQSPWSLHAALTNSSIHAGDTVWLRGGTYVPTNTFRYWDSNPVGWVCTLDGATNNLITIRSYSSEWAVIDRIWMMNEASFLKFQDLEFLDSRKGYNVTNSQYPNGPYIHFALTPNNFTEWVNLVIHDVHNVWGSPASVRGCILWHVGWTDLEHVGYGPPVDFYGNIAAWDFNTFVEHSMVSMVMRSNIVFGGGANKNPHNFYRDVLMDGGGTVDRNFFYNRYQDAGYYGSTLHNISAASNANVVITSNVMVGPAPIGFSNAQTNYNVTFRGNTVYSNKTNEAPYSAINFYGTSGTTDFDYNHYYSVGTVKFYDRTFDQWKTNHPTFDGNSTSSNSAAPPDMVYVIPNRDHAKRCHVAIYNFTHADNVAVSLSGVLTAGDYYKLYSAQNYSGGPIQTGTYNGTHISVPMTNLATAEILHGTNANYQGTVLIQPFAMSPEFGAFVVIPRLAPPRNLHSFAP